MYSFFEKGFLKKIKKEDHSFGFTVSVVLAASQRVRITSITAAGATKIARYCVMFVNSGAKSRKLPKIQEFFSNVVV